MKLIKTITKRLDNVKDFDSDVNTALCNGWVLKKRYVINPNAQQSSFYTHIMLYAELEMEVNNG